ncbi:MAG: serine/threonine-protein kinase [Myxococcales bacterium]
MSSIHADPVLDQGYRLVRLISEGGMGSVYEAMQLRLDRRVAVKVLSSGMADNPEALARFRREVKVMSKLGHPHVVQLLDFGTTESHQPYLVTEYLEGEDLQQRLDRVGSLPLGATLSILRQVASALAAIHANAIVHRDLKPANVFLLELDGAADFVKVLDFGIAKLKTSTTALTQPTSILGTPEYMSPEQASGRVDELDHRCDQWALACMAWHMLSGRPPFAGRDLGEILDRIAADDPPSLLAAQAALPPALEQALLRALAKRPSRRYPTVTAFLRAFESAAGAAQGGVAEPGR